MKLSVILLLGLLAAGAPVQNTYTNPVLFADYSDPDVIRVGDDFYLVASSFCNVPGVPVLHSRDLVHWEIIAHAVPRLPSPRYDRPQHGNGIWAPSIRFHAGEYWIYYGDPDLGLFLVKARHPAGPWDPPLLVRPARGWIDPCPFWDDDGQAWLVHAWAKSRAGFNSILTLHRMNADGTRILDEGVTVFDGHAQHPTIEGPKIYKREGWYYIFAPAGGVKSGWQTVLRARSILGPYEDRIVLEQGSTAINGPHQGGWVETAAGESWFIHFQDRGPWGRLLHLEPMQWREGWPAMGADLDGNGIGEPVSCWTTPALPLFRAEIPAADDFDTPSLGLQWQWPANIDSSCFSLRDAPGFLRLHARPAPDSGASLWLLPGVIGQKFPAPPFAAEVKLQLHAHFSGEQAGMVIFGTDYACLSLRKEDPGYRLEERICRAAEQGGGEEIAAEVTLEQPEIFLRVAVTSDAVCAFMYSVDGRAYTSIGREFTACPGKWVGAKIGLFARGSSGGYADFDFIHFAGRP